MKDQWVADSADFGKYGLLRALCDPDPADECRPLRLGVLWYLTSGGPHNYLDPDCPDSHLYEECDPILYERLREVRRTAPTVAGIEASGLFPADTVYFTDCVPKRQGKEGAKKREEWAQAARDKTTDCCLVFVDPDNGIEPKCGKGSTKPEHARIDELRGFVERDQSLVVYQHQSRHGTISEQVERKRAQVERKLDRAAFAMVYKRHKSDRVIFLIVPAPHHWDSLLHRAEAMLSGDWARHFLMVK